MASTFIAAQQPYEAAVLCIQVWSAAAGDKLLRGLAHPLLAKIGKVGLVDSSGGGKKNGEREQVDSESLARAGDHDGGHRSSNVGNGNEMQAGEEDLVIPRETNLAGVLQSLISLDSNGNFMDPVDDSFAPNYSKLIKTPMCFAMMGQKVLTRQYSTWRLFVEDFERMCYNAMKYNQKRSTIWTAASDLLRSGKKRLEQYAEVGESLVALSKAPDLQATSTPKDDTLAEVGPDNVEGGSGQPASCPDSQGVKMAVTTAVAVPVESKPSTSQPIDLGKGSSAKEDVHLTQRLKKQKKEVHFVDEDPNDIIPVDNRGLRDIDRKEEVEEKVKQTDRGPQQRPSNYKLVDEEIDVEVVEFTDADDFRFDLVDQATECSSSFESTGSEGEGELGLDRVQPLFEAESDLRDGNGALALQEDDDAVGTSERGKKALDADWKTSRRGIEWRCRWLELRMQELQSQSSKYDKCLEKLKAQKIWEFDGEVGEGSSSRTVPLKKIARNHQILRRRQRRKAEEDKDLDLYLGRHPLFSRYGTEGDSKYRRKRRKSDDGLTEGKVESQQAQETHQSTEPESTPEEEDMEEQQVSGQAPARQESIEQILWQIEALQARVEKSKHQLSRGAPLRRNPASSTLSPRGPSQAPVRASSSSPLTLPKNSPAPSTGTPPVLNSGTARAGTGSGLARRKASDYDISNMVMPVNVGAKYVEQVRHEDIETPQWRLVDSLAQSHEQISSDEETEDEHYHNRHSIMEVKERQQRSFPPLKRNPDMDVQTVGKGNTKLGVGKGAAKMASKAKSETLSLPSASPSTPVKPPDVISKKVVPKKQRSKRKVNRRSVAPALMFGIPPNVQVSASEAVKAENISEVDASMEDTDANAGDASMEGTDAKAGDASVEENDANAGDASMEATDSNAVKVKAGQAEDLVLPLPSVVDDKGEVRGRRDVGSGLQL